MEELLRASDLVFDIDRALIASGLQGCERLKRSAACFFRDLF